MKRYLFPWISISSMDVADPWVPCNTRRSGLIVRISLDRLVGPVQLDRPSEKWGRTIKFLGHSVTHRLGYLHENLAV